MLVWEALPMGGSKALGSFAAQDSKLFSWDGTVCLIAQSDGMVPDARAALRQLHATVQDSR